MTFQRKMQLMADIYNTEVNAGLPPSVEVALAVLGTINYLLHHNMLMDSPDFPAPEAFEEHLAELGLDTPFLPEMGGPDDLSLPGEEN